jgi:hypothetical protein
MHADNLNLGRRQPRSKLLNVAGLDDPRWLYAHFRQGYAPRILAEP